MILGYSSNRIAALDQRRSDPDSAQAYGAAGPATSVLKLYTDEVAQM
jgi:hypothetical protein